MDLLTALLLIGLLMLVIERLRPAHRPATIADWWSRAIVFNLIQAAIAWVATITWDRWLPALQPWNVYHWSLPAQVAAGYLLITFIYYWWHRARHGLAILWRWFHQLHHSPARIEVITSFYKHPIEILANGLLSSGILYVLLGVTPLAASMAVAVTGLTELFYHWNIRTPYWLGFILQRPESHRLHHRRGFHHKNYSDLPLWDWLFGTFENARHTEFDCGFEPQQELRLADMLFGRDVTSTQPEKTI